MTLFNYLKQFKNIAWYPSAGKDALSMVCLSYNSLIRLGISKNEIPDCFIFTDYDSQAHFQDNQRFFLDLYEYDNETPFNYENTDFPVTAFNVKELERLDIPFNRDLVEFDNDRYYGRVFVTDILIEHPELGKIIAKLIYVIVENTEFAFNFLLKKKIKVKYAIHSRYGHGFGGGLSNGLFMCNILKDLGTKYFASDINEHYVDDIADRYLSIEQSNTIPVLREIIDFTPTLNWCGYDNTKLYEVVEYIDRGPGFFDNRYRIVNN